MKNIRFFLSAISLLILMFLVISCCEEPASKDDSFTFVFMSDIHLQNDLNAVTAFEQAIDTINKIKPDFVISGGDQIMDALNVSYEEADAAYDLYLEVIKNFDAPVYNTMGNHEIFGMYREDEMIRDHPEYGEKMFENRMGELYYTFAHKGWKFMILNSVEEKKNRRYTGLIEDKQIEWIKGELENTDPNIPIVISTHIPFISAFKQINVGSTVANDSSLVVYNSKEVLDLFEDYNLKLVLQGHLHIQEDIYINGIHYITGGAVSGNWWNGSYHGFEEGFLEFTVTANDFSYEFIDYGWEAKLNND